MKRRFYRRYRTKDWTFRTGDKGRCSWMRWRHSVGATAKLLRVLQGAGIRTLGQRPDSPSGRRLVAATHRNLVEMVKRNDFRSDLYYRLMCFLSLCHPYGAP